MDTIPPAAKEEMFTKYPEIMTFIYIVAIGLPYVLPVYQYLYQPKTFEDGKKEGYEKARHEVRNAAKAAVATTYKYIDKDTKLIKDNAPVADKWLKDKILIAILPRWNLDLLGDKYIVRRPLRAEVNDAWLMTEEDSQEMDEKIQIVLSGTKYEVDPSMVGLSKDEIQQAIQGLLEKRGFKCMVHNSDRHA